MIRTINYDKFPAVLKEKIQSERPWFPENTLIDYPDIVAYRAIERDDDDFSDVTRDDFRSFAELGIHRRLIDEEDKHYYGTSLFENINCLRNALKFPKPKKKIAKGKVYSEGGPIDRNGSTTHVCWWMYEDTSVSGFTILMEEEI